MFKKNKQKEEKQKDPIELEVEAIMGPPPGEIQTTEKLQDTEITKNDNIEVYKTKQPIKSLEIKNSANDYLNTNIQNEASLDDESTSLAIKDIITKEADELLAAKDQNNLKTNQPKKTNHNFFIVLIILIIFLVIIAVSLSLIYKQQISDYLI
jgi:ATP-dependent Zn protease